MTDNRIVDSTGNAFAEKKQDGFVVYEADGMNLLQLKDACVTAIRECDDGDEADAPIYLPTFADRGTKYNKIRLIPEEPLSPMGIIQRNNAFADKYPDKMCAKFNALDVLVWLFDRTQGEIA